MAGLLLASSLAMSILLGPPVPPSTSADDPAPPEPVGDRADVGLLTVSGTVLSPDGSPAAGAMVKAVVVQGERLISSRTDDRGRFRLRGVFGNGVLLHAASSDGADQATLAVPAAAARTALASPIELTLTPAIAHEVFVTSDGRPVGGAHVAASGTGFGVRGLTGEDGKAELRLPAGGRLDEVVAWHPTSGVNGARHREGRPLQDATRLSFLPPAPHRILVLDPEGKPVDRLELDVNARTKDSDWIVAGLIEAAHVRTDADGTATVPWMPRDDLEYVEVTINDQGWKVDRIDLERLGDGITKVHARREIAVGGLLVMPEGVDAEGLLITGFGFGPGNHGDIPYARVRGDGRFTLRVPSDHAYVLGLADLEWASDVWSGVILGKDTWEPADVTLEVYTATPVTVRVTRGPDRKPVANAWVNVSRRGEVGWVDASGEKRSGRAGVRGWLWTDADGQARTGVGRGELELRLTSGDWTEERTIEVASGERIEVEFHRPWLGDRHVAGRLVLDGGRYEPPPTVVAKAWSPRPPYLPLEFAVEVRPDGTFDVAFDAEMLSVFVLDPDRRRSGFARLGPSDSEVNLVMEPMGSYDGVLVDGDGRPLPDRTVRLSVESAPRGAIVARRTDEAGRFRFAGVPAGVPLRLDLEDEDGEPEYYLLGVERLFEPGEVREGDRVTARRRDPDAPTAGPPMPLDDRVRNMCRNVRASGMRALVVLMGDDSQGVVTATGRLMDHDEVPPALGFLTLRLEADQVEAEAKVLADFGWPRPNPGELVLVALSGDRETIAACRIEADRVDAAVAIGTGFLERHGPTPHDALAELAEARRSARSTGRRVWVVLGGPRCGPCFRLARWMEDQRATLEKDYVIVKVMGGLDANAAEVIAEFPESEGEGIPWFAITEADGSILATSEGPLGNIGFPSSLEGTRHLRQMLERTARELTSAEVDGLIESLTANQ